jgi:spermidine/putrescine transport system ATP-binding protein
MTDTVLKATNVAKTYQEGKLRTEVLRDVNLAVRRSETLAIIGASGTGKSTLLHILGGLDAPSAGEVEVDGRAMSKLSDRERGDLRNRSLGFVYQFHHLLPEFTAIENVCMPLLIRGVAIPEARAQSAALLERVGLGARLQHKPGELSGGERQRVALARAFAYDPQILFFDEPLSAIDYKLRKTLEKELKDIHRETGKTFIYITHSLEEAMVMSDRIGVMREGRLVQVGTPNDIYTAPETKFVSEFMGDVNIVKVRRAGNGTLSAAEFDATFKAPPSAPAAEAGHLVIRPESVRFLADPSEAENALKGRLYNEYALGSRIQYQVRVGEQVFIVEKLRQQAFRGRLDDEVTIGWDARDSILVGD